MIKEIIKTQWIEYLWGDEKRGGLSRDDVKDTKSSTWGWKIFFSVGFVLNEVGLTGRAGLSINLK